MGCEACIVARWRSGDRLADPGASPIASAQAVDKRPGAPPTAVLGSARQSEDSAEQVGDASGAKRTQRQVEANAVKRAKLDRGPERDPVAEADALVAAGCLKRLSELCKALLRPDACHAISVVSKSGSGSKRNLWTGAKAVETLKAVQISLRQAHHLPAGQQLSWQDTLPRLQLVGVLGFYQQHPSRRCRSSRIQLLTK